MRYIGILLHCYQPPWQEKEVLSKISAECYTPLFEWIYHHPEPTLTLNINYSLLDLLKTNGHAYLLESLSRLISLNRVELTGTAAFHPILPLVPKTEVERQILLNEAGIQKILGINFKKMGFFPPELAINQQLATIVKNFGYSWLVADDETFVCRHGFAPFNFIPTINDLPIILRSRLWSQRLAFRQIPYTNHGNEFINYLQYELDRWFGGNDGYLLIALDGETFGHHHKNYIDFLIQLWKNIYNKPGWKLCPVSKIVEHFPKKELQIPSGTWSTSCDDFNRGVIFSLWDHPNNIAQKLLWRIIHILLPYMNNGDDATRDLMDRALNSCQFWWLSPEHWNPQNAFKTIPIYLKIIQKVNLSDSDASIVNSILNEIKQTS